MKIQCNCYIQEDIDIEEDESKKDGNQKEMESENVVEIGMKIYRHAATSHDLSKEIQDRICHHRLDDNKNRCICKQERKDNIKEKKDEIKKEN